MGGVQSSNVQQLFSSIVSTLNESVTDNQSSFSQATQTSQTNTLLCGQSPPCQPAPPPSPSYPFPSQPAKCTGIKLINDGKLNTTLTANAQNVIQTNASSWISQAVQQTAQQNQDMINGWLSTSVSAQQANITNATQLADYISNIVETSDFTNCGSSDLVTQNNEVVICNGAIGHNLQLGNDATAVAVANCIANNLSNTLLSDGVVQDVVQQAVQDQSAKNSGLSLAGFLYIGLGILAALLLAGLIYKLLKKPDSTSQSSSSSVSTASESATLTQPTLSVQ